MNESPKSPHGDRSLAASRAGQVLSIARRPSRVLSLLAVVCLLAVPAIVSVCYAKGDVPAMLQHRRKFEPVFTPYEMACHCLLILATASSLFALVLSPSWRRAGLLAVCIVCYFMFRSWLASLRGYW